MVRNRVAACAATNGHAVITSFETCPGSPPQADLVCFCRTGLADVRVESLVLSLLMVQDAVRH